MARGGVSSRSPSHGTCLTSVNVAPHLAEHSGPADSGSRKSIGAVQPLMAHAVVERREDVRLQCTGKYNLFHSAMLLVMHATMQDPICDGETSLLFKGELVAVCLVTWV